MIRAWKSNTSRLKHGCHFAGGILKLIILNENIRHLIQVSLTYISEDSFTSTPLFKPTIIVKCADMYMDNFAYVPSQWDATLQCNAVSYWLGAYTKIIPAYTYMHPKPSNNPWSHPSQRPTPLMDIPTRRPPISPPAKEPPTAQRGVARTAHSTGALDAQCQLCLRWGHQPCPVAAGRVSAFPVATSATCPEHVRHRIRVPVARQLPMADFPNT